MGVNIIKDKNTSREQGQLWFIIPPAVIIILWLCVCVFLPRYFSLQEAGLLGDSYNIITSLFAGLTLLGAGYAVFSQNEQLQLARAQAKLFEEQRTEERLSQKTQENYQRLTAEMNAHSALVQCYTSLATPVQMGEGLAASVMRDLESATNRDKSLQMIRIILCDIQHPDYSFDWGSAELPQKTRHRKYCITLAAEIKRKLILEGDSSEADLLFWKARKASSLLNNYLSELLLLIEQDGLNLIDRGWIDHQIIKVKEFHSIPLDHRFLASVDSLLSWVKVDI